MIYDGGTHVTAALKAVYPTSVIQVKVSRSGTGEAYYDLLTGRNAFFPTPGAHKFYFEGEDIPEPVDPNVKPVAPVEVAAKPTESPAVAWNPAPPVQKEAEVKVSSVIPLNAAAKKNWTPAPPVKK